MLSAACMLCAELLTSVVCVGAVVVDELSTWR